MGKSLTHHKKRLLRTLLCTFLLTVMFALSAFAETIYLDANGNVLQSASSTQVATTITLTNGKVTSVVGSGTNYGAYTDQVNEYKNGGSGSGSDTGAGGSGTGESTSDSGLSTDEKKDIIRNGPIFGLFLTEMKAIYGSNTMTLGAAADGTINSSNVLNPIALLGATYGLVTGIIDQTTGGTIYAVFTALAVTLMIIYFLADLTSKDIPQNFGTNSGDLLFFIKPFSKLVIGIAILIAVPKIIGAVLSLSQFVFKVALHELANAGTPSASAVLSPIKSIITLVSIGLGIFGVFLMIPGLVSFLKGVTEHDGGERTEGARKLALAVVVIAIAIITTRFSAPIEHMITGATSTVPSWNSGANGQTFDAEDIALQILEAADVKVAKKLSIVDILTNFFKMIGMMILMLIPYIIGVVADVLLVWTVVSRMFNMVLQAVLAPLAFTDFYSERPFTDTRAFSFCRDFLGLCFQSTVILLAFAVSEKLMATFTEALTSSISGNFGSLAAVTQVALFLAVLRITQATVVMGSGGLAKKAFGA